MSTVRNLVQEEESLRIELLDLKKWKAAKNAGLAKTRVDVNFKYTNNDDPDRDQHLYSLESIGLSREILVDMVEARLSAIIEAKERKLLAIRLQLKDIDQKLGNIIIWDLLTILNRTIQFTHA